MRAHVALLSPQRRRLVLIVVALALMMVVSAVSGLNVALPDLARDTGASQSQLQWIVDAYLLVFAGLLMTAGSLGDRFGRRRALMTGLVIFAIGSALAAPPKSSRPVMRTNFRPYRSPSAPAGSRSPAKIRA